MKYGTRLPGSESQVCDHEQITEPLGASFSSSVNGKLVTGSFTGVWRKTHGLKFAKCLEEHLTYTKYHVKPRPHAQCLAQHPAQVYE